MSTGSGTHLRLRAAPILKMVGVTALVGAVIVAMVVALRSLPDFETTSRESPWVLSILVHVPQFAIPFAIIAGITRGRISSYGFNARQKPPLFRHVNMLALGAAFGLLLSLRYVPQIVAGEPVDVPRPVTPANVLGTMAFQWIVVGLCEETMFRGLVQTYLENTLGGSVTMAGHRVHVGIVIGAVLWGLFHFINLLVMPTASVLFTVVFTTLAGVAMGYAYHQTGSLLTTIIVHNTIFGVPLTIGYILNWLQ